MQHRAKTIESKAATRPLFVIGMWRSGTSALYALLNQHPEIALLYEGDLHLLSPAFLKGRQTRDIVTRWNFWNGAARRHHVETEQLPEQMVDVNDGLRSTYEAYAARKGATISGEKSPNYYDRVADLAKEFPDARFLVIWRNPLSVCASILAARERCFWFDRRGMMLRALVGFRHLRQQCDQIAKRGVSLLEIQYEELVGDTEQVMKRVCAFLGIPFDPRMTSLDGADVSAIYPEEHHSKVRREGIHLMTERGYLIPAEIRRKINRYLRSWKESFSSWPVYPERVAAGESLGIMESAVDQVVYRGLRFYDSLILLLYSIGPFWPLKTYRSAKSWYRKYSREGAEAIWKAYVPQLRGKQSPLVSGRSVRLVVTTPEISAKGSPRIHGSRT